MAGIIEGSLMIAGFLLYATACFLVLTFVIAACLACVFLVFGMPFVYRSWVRGVEVSRDRVVRFTFNQYYRLDKCMPEAFEIGHIRKDVWHAHKEQVVWDEESFGVPKVFYTDTNGVVYQIQFSFVGFYLYCVMYVFTLLREKIKTKSDRRCEKVQNAETALKIVNDMQEKVRRGILP